MLDQPADPLGPFSPGGPMGPGCPGSPANVDCKMTHTMTKAWNTKFPVICSFQFKVILPTSDTTGAFLSLITCYGSY